MTDNYIILRAPQQGSGLESFPPGAMPADMSGGPSLQVEAAQLTRNEADDAQRDPSAVRGTYFLNDSESEFSIEIGEGTATVRFLEFRPSGRTRITAENMRRVLLVMTEGEVGEGGAVSYKTGEDPTNWAVFDVDQVTGRAKIHRP